MLFPAFRCSILFSVSSLISDKPIIQDGQPCGKLQTRLQWQLWRFLERNRWEIFICINSLFKYFHYSVLNLLKRNLLNKEFNYYSLFIIFLLQNAVDKYIKPKYLHMQYFIIFNIIYLPENQFLNLKHFLIDMIIHANLKCHLKSWYLELV